MRPPREGTEPPYDGLDRTGMPPRADLGRTERRALLGISVPRRSSWPELEQHDQRVGDVSRRHGEAQEAVRDLLQQRATAPTADADALAGWELGNRKGAKPEPTIDTLDRQVADAERDRDGLERAVDLVLEERASFIQKHRGRLVGVAEQQTETARARMVALIDELAVTRASLVECRQATLWALCYPDAAASAQAPTGLVARGLAQPIVDTLGLQPAPQLIAGRLLDLLRKDAELLATAMAAEQRKLLGGDDAKPAGAFWNDSDEGREWERLQRQEARDRYQREWGRPPA